MNTFEEKANELMETYIEGDWEDLLPAVENALERQDQETREECDKQCQAALAAIRYAINNEASDGWDFLRAWNDGEFPEIREWFPDAPIEVFIGVDPLYEDK